MSDPVLPRLGRYAPSPRALAGVGVAAACAVMLFPSAIVPRGASDGTSRWSSGTSVASLDRGAAVAERLMRQAEAMILAAKIEAGIVTDPAAGIDYSGLIGSELTPLVTTLGNLEAKRTATNPSWAAVLTRQLSAAGIGRGDLIAASFSGSFPGLNLAVMAASHALDADLAAVSSVTASTWGANQPGFTWPEIESRLVASRLLPRASIAVTTGGDGDRALDLSPEGQELALTIRDRVAQRLGVPILHPASFEDAVRQRLSAYRRAANGRPIALYVNVGGATASLGQSTAVLRLRSGFISPGPFDRSEDRGVMARFAEQGVKVLTLLNIRDLALRWGIPLNGPTS